MNTTLKIVAVVILLIVSNLISWNVAKNRGVSVSGAVSAALPAPVPPPGGVRAFGGTIESVSDTGFALKLSPYDPFASKGPTVRAVTVQAETVLERLIQKDPATIQKEQTAFMEKISAKGGPASGGQNPSAPIVPPEPFIREKISLTDLQAGDLVLVSANKDISTAKEFVAVRVSLQPRIDVPATASSPAVKTE